MAINLQKGQTVNLDKNTNDLSKITIGLGWKMRQPEKKGFFSKLMGGGKKEEDFDIDAIAFLLDQNGKVANLGNKLVGSDIIFFNNLRHPSGNIYHTGDNRVGGVGQQDDEQIIVRLNDMDPSCSRILFMAVIYQGMQRNQSFGEIESAFIRAVDGKGSEIVRYNLTADPESQGKRTMVFAECYRHGAEWKFRALGEGHTTDSFIDILRPYLYT